MTVWRMNWAVWLLLMTLLDIKKWEAQSEIDIYGREYSPSDLVFSGRRCCGYVGRLSNRHSIRWFGGYSELQQWSDGGRCGARDTRHMSKASCSRIGCCIDETQYCCSIHSWIAKSYCLQAFFSVAILTVRGAICRRQLFIRPSNDWMTSAQIRSLRISTPSPRPPSGNSINGNHKGVLAIPDIGNASRDSILCHTVQVKSINRPIICLAWPLANE